MVRSFLLSHQIENYLGPSMSKEITLVQVHNTSETDNFASSFHNYEHPGKILEYNLARLSIVSMWLLSTKLQLQNLGMIQFIAQHRKAKGRRAEENNTDFRQILISAKLILKSQL